MFNKSREKKIKAELEANEQTQQSALTGTKERLLQTTIFVISIALCVFQLYTTATRTLGPIPQRATHLGFALALLFLYSAVKQKNMLFRCFDYVFAVAGIAVNVYNIINYEAIIQRAATLTASDIIIGVLTIFLVIEGARRSIGIWMPLIALVFLAYCYFGRFLPGLLHIRALSINRAIGYIAYGTEGIFGTCLSASATFVFMFLLFGECLVQLGAGDFIIEISQSLMGHVRGGPAKIAVISSCLFGSVSGSAVANVASTGCLTIPLMKKMGFEPDFAGGVESAASSGGSIMPPVMGTAVFVMSEIISVGYNVICVAAIIPALLYYMGIFVMVDLESCKRGLLGLPKEELPDSKEVLKKGWHYLLGIMVLLVLLIGLQWSAGKSALWGTVVLCGAHIIRKLASKQSIDWSKVKVIILNSSKAVISVAAATSCAGIIVGAFAATGLNLRFSSLLVALAGERLPILLVLSMIGAIVLGMGLPATPVYILLAVLVAPALVSMGVSKLAAHMFILYFGAMAPITPPVGLAFYVASGIAESSPMKTGLQAAKLACVGFIVPFVFAYNPGLLLQGSFSEIIVVVITTAIGVLSLAFAFEGYFMHSLNPVIRILFIVCAAMSIIPESITDVIGIVLFVVLIAVCWITKKGKTKEREVSKQFA